MNGEISLEMFRSEWNNRNISRFQSTYQKKNERNEMFNKNLLVNFYTKLLCVMNVFFIPFSFYHFEKILFFFFANDISK